MKKFITTLVLLSSLSAFADTTSCSFDIVNISELSNYAKVQNANKDGMSTSEAYSLYKYEIDGTSASKDKAGLSNGEISRLCGSAATACADEISNNTKVCILRGVQERVDQVQ